MVIDKKRKKISKLERKKMKKRAMKLGDGNQSLAEKTFYFSSKDHELLKNFVKKFGNNYSSEMIHKFQKLMEINGTFLSEVEIKTLIKREIHIQEYESFKERMLYNQPHKNLNYYIQNLLDLYGENYPKYINLFLELLNKKNINFDENTLNVLIKDEFEKNELNVLEKELYCFDDTNFMINDLDSLTGHEFEEFIKILFNKMGYLTESTKLTRDQGADLIINKFGIKTVVQVKRYSGKVTNKAVQEVTAAIAHYKAENGMVITTSEFTSPAIELASSNDIQLIDRQKLEELIYKYY